MGEITDILSIMDNGTVAKTCVRTLNMVVKESAMPYVLSGLKNVLIMMTHEKHDSHLPNNLNAGFSP